MIPTIQYPGKEKKKAYENRKLSVVAQDQGIGRDEQEVHRF